VLQIYYVSMTSALIRVQVGASLDTASARGAGRPDDAYDANGYELTNGGSRDDFLDEIANRADRSPLHQPRREYEQAHLDRLYDHPHVE